MQEMAKSMPAMSMLAVMLILMSSSVGGRMQRVEGAPDVGGGKLTEMEVCMNKMLSFLGCVPSLQNAMAVGNVAGTWSINPTSCCDAVVNMDPSCFSSILNVLAPRASPTDYKAALASSQACAIHKTP